MRVMLCRDVFICFSPTLCDAAGIAVGLPVTQQPPHRSRRAVFPHRAFQRYSLFRIQAQAVESALTHVLKWRRGGRPPRRP